MTKQKTSTLIAISVAILALVSTIGFEITTIFAEDTEEKGYKFARDTSITGIFEFKSGEIQVAEFEVFEQENGFDRTDTPTFELWKVVESDTPILHFAADKSQQHSGTSQLSHNYEDFNVNILLAQGGIIVRELQYNDCEITNYQIETEFDKEEGWLGKVGFAVVEIYEFECDGYAPYSPIYNDMKKIESVKTTSSLDLRETNTWSDVYKHSNP